MIYLVYKSILIKTVEVDQIWLYINKLYVSEKIIIKKNNFK